MYETTTSCNFEINFVQLVDGQLRLWGGGWEGGRRGVSFDVAQEVILTQLSAVDPVLVCEA